MSATSTERTVDQDLVAPDDGAIAPRPVVVRRRAALLLLMGTLASGLAIAFLWRATGSGSWVDALLCAVLGAMGAGYLTALIDARAPLLVVDELGVRVRIGREWRGLPWQSVERVWVLPSEGVIRDPRLVVVPRDLGHVIEGLDASSVRAMRMMQRLHGAPLAMPLGRTVRLVCGDDLVADLRALSAEHGDDVVAVADQADPADALGDGVLLTDEMVARREGVVRALPGVDRAPVEREPDVSHVALVHEPEPRDDERSDIEDSEEAEDFSLLGRIFDFGAPAGTATAPVHATRDEAPDEVRDETRDETDETWDSRWADSQDAVATGEIARVEESATPDVDARSELTSDPSSDLTSDLTSPAVGRSGAWWSRVRSRFASRSESAQAEEAVLDDQAVAVDGSDVSDDGAAQEPDDRDWGASAEVSAGAPTERPVIGAPATRFASAVSSVQPPAQPAASSSPDPVEGPGAPGMEPAARVAVAPLVPSRSSARRVEVVHRVEDPPAQGAAALDPAADDHGVHLLPESAVLRPGSDDLLSSPYAQPDSAPDRHGVTPLATPGDAVAPLVLGGFATRPAYDPVIGPEVRAARTRLGFSVDELADRTRIRPHVLESIEVDDFAPTGGDVYARGHLRTLGRVLGKDAEVWVQQFDSRYATGPTTAKRVFEAELASAVRPARGPRSGPHWSLVAAVVLALGVVWAAASSLSDEPVEVVTPAPLVAPEAGQQADMPAAAPARVLSLRNGAEAATVTVRDGDGAVVLATALQPGEMRRVRLALPVRVIVSEGGPVQLRYDGEPRGRLAAPGVVVPGAEGEAALPSARRLR